MSGSARYQNPLITRYASKEMAHIFSADNKYMIWRKLWLALAKSQQALGVDIGDEQLQAMEKHLATIDYEQVRKIEQALKHDVMSHITAFAEQAKAAAPIIHLGATSAFVTDNSELIMMRDAGRLLFHKLLQLIGVLARSCRELKGLAVLGFTHFQPAQPTTLGKRLAMWLQDMLTDAVDLHEFLTRLPFRGAKGTVGSQASYLELLDNQPEKCRQLDTMLVDAFGFSRTFAITGQTYPRKTDYHYAAILSGVAQSLSKMAIDIRLLQHRREVMEPFGSRQVGSSAMPYKRNPMRCERLTALARFVICRTQDTAHTAANQWLERSLDDSAIRRIAIPEISLASDAIITLGYQIISGLQVNRSEISAHLSQYMPFLMAEKLMAEMVKQGFSRQEVHEKIRRASLKSEASHGQRDMMSCLLEDETIAPFAAFMESNMDVDRHVGLAPQQVERFLSQDVRPFLQAHLKENTPMQDDHGV